MSWLTNPENPKARKIALAVFAIGLVVMIAIRQYLVALGFACFLLSDYLQHRTKKWKSYYRYWYSPYYTPHTFFGIMFFNRTFQLDFIVLLTNILLLLEP